MKRSYIGKSILRRLYRKSGFHIAITGLLTFALIGALVQIPYCETEATTQQQIDQVQHEKDDLEAQQQANEDALDALRTEQGELQVRVNELNGQLE